MKVLLFRDRFEAPIRAGTKRQTIREPRKRPIVPGDQLSLRRWSGLPYRSKQIVIGSAVCKAVQHVRIDFAGVWPCIALNGIVLNSRRLILFIEADGFDGPKDFVDHWHEHKGFPFEGVVYQWTDFQEETV